MKPVFSRSWSDTFGSLCIALEGGTGGLHTLILCPLEHHVASLEVLTALPYFKGRITLAVLEQIHATPALALLHDLEPHQVLALDATAITTNGNALTIKSSSETSSSGLTYQEGKTFPAWQSSLNIIGTLDSSVFASAIAIQTKAVLACAPTQLSSVLTKLLG